MNLEKIYQPIQKDLNRVEKVIENSLSKSRSKKILEINKYLLDSPGKRLRPALVILCAKASQKKSTPVISKNLSHIAAALELIHMASLLHDDVIDRSNERHNKSTINSKWGMGAAIALGDFIYSEAFRLIAQYGNKDILQCISVATKNMCEGEFIQVSERENPSLLRENYLLIIKKKSASLFMASCQSGTLLLDANTSIRSAIKDYGTHFGMAFQMLDDYLDLISNRSRLGKSPGQDLKVGEMTLPIINLMEILSHEKKDELKKLLNANNRSNALPIIKEMFLSTGADLKTKNDISHHIALANQKIQTLPKSSFQEKLLELNSSVYNFSQ